MNGGILINQIVSMYSGKMICGNAYHQSVLPLLYIIVKNTWTCHILNGFKSKTIMDGEGLFKDISIKRVRPSERFIWLWLAPQLSSCLPKDVIRYVCKYIVHIFTIPKEMFFCISCKRFRWRYYRILCDWAEQKNVYDVSPKASGRIQCLRFSIDHIPTTLLVLFVTERRPLLDPIEKWQGNKYIANIHEARLLVWRDKLKFDVIIFNNCKHDFAYRTDAKVLCIMQENE